MFYIESSLRGVTDFRTWYSAAYMLRTGQGAQIYDMEKLEVVKNTIVPLNRPFMQPMHLAYEAVLLVPLTFVTYKAAFFVFILLNVGILAWCVVALKDSLSLLSDTSRLLPAMLFLGYYPISRAITQGQDSVILLALLIACNLMLCKGRDYSAGLCIGIGLFKFQIVLPIVLLFLIWKRWKFGLGFAASASVALLSSFLIVGWHGVYQYGSILAGMSYKLTTLQGEIRYSISPLTMMNLRGMVTAILGDHVGHWWVQGIVVALSALFFFIAACSRPSLPLAISAAALVSYHLLAHDATVLIIPIVFCLSSRSVWVVLASILAFLMPNAGISIFHGFIGGFGVLSLFLAVWLGSGAIKSSGIFVAQN